MSVTMDNRAIIGGLKAAEKSIRRASGDEDGFRLLGDAIGLCVFLAIIVALAAVFSIGW